MHSRDNDLFSMGVSSSVWENSVHMSVEYRQARPEDASDAAPLIHSCGPAAFDYVFSHRTRTDAMTFLQRSFAQEHGEFGYGIHTVGVMGERVVVIGSVYSGRRALSFFLSAVRQVFSCYGPWQGIAVSRRGLQVERLCRPPTGDLLYVAHIAVVPECRGLGIGRCLIEQLLRAAKPTANGRAIAALDVACDNPRAQALYKRLGFRVTRELRSTLKNGTATVPSHRRMELPL